ncbi:MAG: response regulator [Deltaproteobacteria bacterium]|jgi:CheY-like chemotaxis protein|nr:response regulator [Deltaproteobacteria bacterium]MDP3040334.1 response regulator [Deltaproteobacteria bacterium]
MASKKKILIVDDEQDILTYLSTLLEDNGYNTVLAKNGEEALKQMEAALPDLITLDISMPGKSGVKFYRDMKVDDRWKHIPIIIITGVSEDFKKFISSRQQVPPPEGYLSKPIEKEEILALVKKFTA